MDKANRLLPCDRAAEIAEQILSVPATAILTSAGCKTCGGARHAYWFGRTEMQLLAREFLNTRAGQTPAQCGVTKCVNEIITKAYSSNGPLGVGVDVAKATAIVQAALDNQNAEANAVIAELVAAIAPLAKERVMVYEVNERGKRIPVGEKLTQRAYDIGRLIARAHAYIGKAANDNALPTESKTA